jgi:hypothetical protein
MGSDDQGDVPRVGRGRFFGRLSGAQVMQILLLVGALVAIVLMRNSCAHGVSGWFETVAPSVVDAGR